MKEANFQLSLFTNKNSTRPRDLTISWQTFCERLASPIIRSDKDGKLFSPAFFNPSYRLKDNVKEISLLVMDYDHQVDIERDFNVWRNLGVSCALYTTHSHKRKTDCNPAAEARFRIVVLLSEPVPAKYFSSLWQWASVQSGGKIDESAKDSSRMYYLPAKHSNTAEYEYRIADGQPLDWRSLNLTPEQEPVKTCKKKQTTKTGKSLPLKTLAIEEVAFIKMARQRFGAKFDRLLSGSAVDYPDPKSGLPDNSRADEGFAVRLCLVGASDEQVERIWRHSGRNREKLDIHPTYIQRTLEAAREWIADQQETLDISDLQEVEDDDPPISDNPVREKYLRQLPRNKALLSDTYAIYLRLLRFEGKSHTRFLTAITQAGGARTGRFRATNEQLQRKYAGTGKAASINTVKRDKERFLKEQWRCDVALIGYRSFPYNPETKNCPPSEYQNFLLRKSLEAINIVLTENPNDKRVDRTKLEDACKRLLAEFPKPYPKVSHKKSKAKPKKTEFEKADTRFLKALDALLTLTPEMERTPESVQRLQRLLYTHINEQWGPLANMAHFEPYTAQATADQIQADMEVISFQ